MTQRETLAAIKAAGMAARYSAEFGEWRVTFTADDMPSAERREAVACYTPDSEDAISTARAMRAHAERHGFQ
jgi:hypothetical protein